MRLIRSNDDPKLLADLERLAGRSDASIDPDLAPPADDVGGRGADPGSAAPLEDPFDDAFVRRFVQGAVHLRKYAPFYAGAGLWMLTMLLIQPLGSGGNRGSEVAQPTGVTRANVIPASVALIPQAEPDVAASPVFYSAGASTFSSDDVSTFSDFSDAPEPAPEQELASEPPPPTFDEPNNFSSTEDEPAVPKPLSILASGYTSATGGTPLEQDPGAGGLPVGAAGGNDSKRSFIRLAGDETVLRLKEAGSGNVASNTAVIKACPIGTADWKADRGKALSAGPVYSSACVTGTRAADGLWTFDMAALAPLAAGNGFALVPAAGTALNFQVVFAPVVVRAA